MSNWDLLERMLSRLKQYFGELAGKREQFVHYQPTLAELRNMHWVPTLLSASRPAYGFVMILLAPGTTSWMVFWCYFAWGTAFQFIFDLLDGYAARKLGVGSKAGATFDLYCDFVYGAFVLGLIGKVWTHDYKFTLTGYGFVLLYLFVCWKYASFRKRYWQNYLLLMGTGFALGIAWSTWERHSIARVQLKPPVHHDDTSR